MLTVYQGKKKPISLLNNIQAAIMFCNSAFAWEHMGLILMSQCDCNTQRWFTVLTEARPAVAPRGAPWYRWSSPQCNLGSPREVTLGPLPEATAKRCYQIADCLLYALKL